MATFGIAQLLESLADYRAPNFKIHSLLKEKQLIGLKKGLYVVAPSNQNQLISLSLVANHLYGPSYVSLESATDFLDWIEIIGPILAKDMAKQVDAKISSEGVFFRSFGAHLFESIPCIHNDFQPLNQPSEAINLAESYLDDNSCLMQLSLLLAFFMVDKDSAANYLRDIGAQQKVAIDMLLAKSPRKPEFSDLGIQLGGKDEAWVYRDDNLELWKTSGALQWLRNEYKKPNLPKA